MTAQTINFNSPGFIADGSYYGGSGIRQTSHKLDGRDRDLRDLLDLLVAERIVLCYAPASAGKCSFLHEGLLEALRREGLSPLPVVRVGLPREVLLPAANRYLLSAKLSLEGFGAETGHAGQYTQALEKLAAMSLTQYLDQRPWSADDLSANQREEVLIFAQLEEVLTLDPTDQAAKQEFFQQVGAALRNRSRRALLAIQEEQRAALASYLRYLPNGLPVTFQWEPEMFKAAP